MFSIVAIMHEPFTKIRTIHRQNQFTADLMKIDLPLETWVDVFGFLSRLQLVQLVPNIERVENKKNRQTIGDRQFVSFIQFYLHKCGEITLGRLESDYSSWNGYDQPIVKAYKYYPFCDLELPMADVQISQNIKNFEEIHLRYFDESVLRFLQKFQHNSLLTNVNLYLPDCRTADDLVLARIMAMANFMPLLTSIDSIVIHGSSISAGIQRLLRSNDNEYSILATKRMLESTRFLYIWNGLICVWYSDWLYTPTDDGQPRYLQLNDDYDFGEDTFPPFIGYIKKDFLEAKTSSSFFVHLYFRDTTNVQSVTLDNGKTQEKLVIARETFGISISRHPIGANEKWIEEMNKDFLLKDASHKQRKITIHL